MGGAQGQLAKTPPTSSEVQRRTETRRQAYRSPAGTLEFGPVHMTQTPVPVFSRVEAQFTLRAAYTNPFDPADIQVDGVITLPDGRRVTVPAFFCVPFQPKKGLTQMAPNITYEPAGKAGWRLRFAPDLPGEYRLVIRARDGKGRQVESSEGTFRAEASARKGFVRVAAGNPMFFENSADGSLFWPVGANVAYTHTSNEKNKGASGQSSYEHYFGQAKGKMNATRVWLCHWAWLEWTPQQAGAVWPEYGGPGYYNQMIATGMDRVFELAEAQGLRLMLVTEDNNEFMVNETSAGTWNAHPYNQVNGGPCGEPGEFFSSAEARRLYRNRLRYIVARWGYSDALWGINSCNDFSNPDAEKLDWLKHVRGYVHELFAGYRPIIYGTNFRFEANQVADYRQAGRGPVNRDKPNVVQECFYTRVAGSFRQELHEQLWNGLGRGLGGIMVWDHVLVDRTGSWDEFLPLTRFVQDLPLHRHSWQPMEARVLSASAEPAGPYHQVVVVRSYGDVPDWGAKAPRNRFEVGLDQTRQWLEGFSSTLFGERSRYKAWRNPPTFLLNLPDDGKLLVGLKEIAGHSNTLLISRRAGDTASWQPAASVQLDHGRRLVTPKEEWVEVAIPKGPQQVMLDVRGDWIRTECLAVSYPLPNAEGLVSASGWTDGRSGFLYLQNQSQSRLLNEVLHQKPVALTAMELEVGGLQDGQYRIEVCGTDTGLAQTSSQADCRQGRMRFRLPALSRDVALKFSQRLNPER